MYGIKERTLIPNPQFDPLRGTDIGNLPTRWHFEIMQRNIQVGDIVEFLCNGRGRGGHFSVRAEVLKVNPQDLCGR